MGQWCCAVRCVVPRVADFPGVILMIGSDTRASWEELLDQEVGKLMGPEFLQQRDAAATSRDDSQLIDLSHLDEDTPLTIREFRAKVLEAVKSGMKLPEDICDESGQVLLPAGRKISKEFIQVLRERGIGRVRLRAARRAGRLGEIYSLDKIISPTTQALDERLAGELQYPIEAHPVRGWRRPRLPIDDLKSEAQQGIQKYEETSEAVATVCDALQVGRKIALTEIRDTVNRFVDMASHDFDLLPLIVAMQESKDEYLFDHCVNVAMLSMAMGSQLGYDRETVAMLGMGGLLHDVGMLRVPSEIRLATQELSDREWHEIHRHPLHTLDMLSELRGLPQTVKFIAYQAHERSNGEGYPRRRNGNQIHPFTKIVSIVDAFAAMTRDRTYREAIRPYYAVKTILEAGVIDAYDRELIRVFLDTVSLFPVGSRVKLSNGMSCRVLRANPGLHTSPLVEQLDAGGMATGFLLDLAEEDSPKVVQVE